MNDIDVNFEPLPGYRLIERLGAGGYGEVWRAEAPGGLTKAIKFVFGKNHEKRASNELRALDHVRGVRHPFLLSLERIEVVDGRLLVVTELADGSLKDRFEQCRGEGQRGVPRDEVLRYLRDAADALDFMSDSHALQHLDIKPENLLLLAGHVKVADFGLVKDIRQSQASLVGGMTPLYAAPEVFRGTPSRHSDQYSLAIVYQEMVTGSLPFMGGNAAELMLQHLNDEPDLSALSTSDRYAVSRSLAKDPQHRYATCRAFINALFNATSSTSASQTAPVESHYASAAVGPDATSRETIPTDFLDDEQPAAWNARGAQLLVDMPPSDCRLEELPPVDLTGRDQRPIPTLVLGIGGSAGRVLNHFRRIMADQWGGTSHIPAVQMLLLDTDARGASEATRSESGGLSADEVLSLPLRRPQHYRENSQQLLHWLSRRWLYNIPRSLRTEGLRPLGRLALADYARQSGQRIRRAMVQALDTNSIDASNAVVGQQFRTDALRVFVVASISGGTGGGMSLDIGYAVRAILQKLGLAQANIIGLMMHSTGRDARHGELARVNAFSWLSEFHHFQQFENPYPGDLSCGLPAHAAGVPAFDHTYLIHLGENLDNAEFDSATQAVAEYLRLNTLSSARAFFDACRTAPASGQTTEQGNASKLRSFGVYRQAAAPSEFCDEFAGVVCQQVLSTWRGAPCRTSAATGNANTSKAEDIQLVQRLHLDAGGVAANARSLVELELGMDSATFLSAWLNNQAGPRDSGTNEVFAAIDQAFVADSSGGASEQEVSVLGRTPAAIITPLADKLRNEVHRWITRRIDDPQERLAGARRALERIHDHLHQVDAELQRLRGRLTNRLLQIRAEAYAPIVEPSSSKSAEAGHVNQDLTNEYFHSRLDQVAILAAEHAIHGIVADAKATADEITSLGREMDQMATAVGRSAASRISNSDAGEGRAKLAIEFKAKLPDIAAQVDACLQTEYLDSNGGLAKTIMQGGRPRAQLVAKLQELSRRAVYQSLAGVSAGQTGKSPDQDLQTALAHATPALLEYGGRRRMLAILPGDAAGKTSAESVAQSLGTGVTAVSGPDNNLTFCVEADGLSLEHIALDFVERRRDRVEFADRVHCRIDVAWASLVSTTSVQDSSIWDTQNGRQTQAQQDMSKTLVI